MANVVPAGSAGTAIAGPSGASEASTTVSSDRYTRAFEGSALPDPWFFTITVIVTGMPAPPVFGAVTPEITRSGGVRGVPATSFDSGPSPNEFVPLTT